MPEQFFGNQALIMISEERAEFSSLISQEYLLRSVEVIKYGIRNTYNTTTDSIKFRKTISQRE